MYNFNTTGYGNQQVCRMPQPEYKQVMSVPSSNGSGYSCVPSLFTFQSATLPPALLPVKLLTLKCDEGNMLSLHVWVINPQKNAMIHVSFVSEAEFNAETMYNLISFAEEDYNNEELTNIMIKRLMWFTLQLFVNDEDG